MKAPDILRRSAQHIEDRAAARDQAEGERSMARTVSAFNALTGHQLTERDGWLFMVALKMARACTTTTGIPDDYEDLAAYAALAGESVAVVHPNAFASMAADLEGVSYARAPMAEAAAAFVELANVATAARPSGTVEVTIPGFMVELADGETAVPDGAGGVLVVPAGFRWIAQDYNGEWWAYTAKPGMSTSCWFTTDSAKRITSDEEVKPNEKWRDTLRQVTP